MSELAKWVRIKDCPKICERTIVYSQHCGPVVAYWHSNLDIWASEMFLEIGPYKVYDDITHWLPVETYPTS